MFSNNKTALFTSALLLSVFGLTDLSIGDGYPDRFAFGTSASNEEISAVDIDVMPDGRGLPTGRGTYAEGKEIYVSKCSACHGTDLKGKDGLPEPLPSTRVSLHLLGGRGTLTTNRPVLTVESYWPYATTLFDYIKRAMPFTEPGSLKDEEVYALVSYILSEANITDKALVLDASNLAKIQMPNKDGFIVDPRPEFFK